MDTLDVVTDGFSRVRDTVHQVADGLAPDQLTFRLDAEANTIAWLLWHLARVQDDHVAGLGGHEQVWTADGFARRLDLPFDDSAIGYGFDAEQVAAVRVESVGVLVGYFDAVHERTSAYLAGVSPADLDSVVDDSYDPPVTVGARLVSVISDDLQHVGQAALIRGVAERS